jgi:hypothetical protein
MNKQFKPGDVVRFRNTLYPSLHNTACEIIHVHEPHDAYDTSYGVKFIDHEDVRTMFAHDHELSELP